MAIPVSKTSTEGRYELHPLDGDKSHNKLRPLKNIGFPVMMWICMMLACLGSIWFSYYYFLIPQPESFTPDWHGAQWIQATDGDASVAYFHYNISLEVVPNAASVTVVANQVFHLYVNGVLIASDGVNFAQGDALRPYMYDVSPLLSSGKNVIGIRVANMDQQKPDLRANLNITIGKQHVYYGTSNRWQATSQSSAVFPASVGLSNDWTKKDFDTSSWKGAEMKAFGPATQDLLVSPLLYQQPLPANWMSVGNSHVGYFVWQLGVSSAVRAAWLRLTATDSASVMINGNLFFTWNGQPPMPSGQRSAYLGNLDNNNGGYTEPNSIQTYGYSAGIYNIAPYLHAGVNTIAIQVTVSGTSTLFQNKWDQSAALASDLLTVDTQGHTRWYTGAKGWHASAHMVDRWEKGNAVSLAWSSPSLITMPSVLHRFAIPDSDMMPQNSSNVNNAVLLSNQDPLEWCLFQGRPVASQGTQGYCGPLDPRNFQPFSTGSDIVPASLVCQVIVGSILAVLAPWLLLSIALGRLVFGSIRGALERLCLAYLPALTVESVLLVLSLEPLMPQPFPYTLFWGVILIALVVVGYLLLFLNAIWPIKKGILRVETALARENSRTTTDHERVSPRRGRSNVLLLLRWLRLHWPLPLLVLIAVPLIFYDIHYEPYWQDELSSLYAAKGILAHGYPIWPSGFLYAKSEFYSYILAVIMLFFGDQGDAPRMLSAVEFMISIPLFYFIGCYFFNRHVAALAVAMLVLSPYAFSWARQVRMYEQAQLMVLCVLFIFYKAVQEQQRVRYIYISIGILVLTYLSHEEIFIIFPALLCCVLLISKDSKHLLPSVIYQKHWWFASLIGASIIVTQLLIVYFSHPPVLGTDQSMRPPIQFTTDNVRFYMNMLVLTDGKNPLLPLDTILATAGCIRALRNRDSHVWYCALFLIISLCTLVFLFTMQDTRYFYPILTIYFLMAAYGFVSILQAFWCFARPHLAQMSVDEERNLRSSVVAQPIKLIAGGMIALMVTVVLIPPMLPISNYNLFVSRIANISSHRHSPDYDDIGKYMQNHEQKGDVVISIIPDIIMYYYAGRSDYFISIDKALFLFEHDGHTINTGTGAIALFNQSDLEAILSSHTRIWLITDGSGPYQLQAWKRFSRPEDFHIVYEGYQSAIYLRE